jgi:hypothetical protein
MNLISPVRIGLWGNYGPWKPFRSLGLWIGPDLGDILVGQKFVQKLPSGIVKYHFNVLFDRQKPRKEQLENVLVLDTKDPKLLEELWAHPNWKKEDEDDFRRESEAGKGSPPADHGIDVPW